MSIFRRLPGKWTVDLPQSERSGWALGILGVLSGVGYLPEMASLWILYEITFRDEPFRWWMLLNVVAIPPGLMIVAWGNFFIRSAGRHFTEVVASPVELHARSFCLYLRPFDYDFELSDIQKLSPIMSAVRAWTSYGRTEEEYLARLLKPIGPMVAAGIPGGPAPFMGAKRMYLPAEDWQDPVRDLMLRARLVVIALGPGAGTMWELVEAVRIVPPERLLIIVPMESSEYAAFRTNATDALNRRSKELQRHSGEEWSPPLLPDYVGEHQIRSRIQAVIHFSPEWDATFVRLNRAPMFTLGTWTFRSRWFGGALNTAIAPLLTDRQLPAVLYRSPKQRSLTTTATRRSVFLSYDRDHDDDVRELLVSLSKSADSPYRIAGWSTEISSTSAEDATRRKIADADLVVVICGEHTDAAAGVSAEISVARKAGTEYVLLVGRTRRSRACKKPSAAADIDAMYSLAWPNLKKLVAGMR